MFLLVFFFGGGGRGSFPRKVLCIIVIGLELTLQYPCIEWVSFQINESYLCVKSSWPFTMRYDLQWKGIPVVRLTVSQKTQSQEVSSRFSPQCDLVGGLWSCGIRGHTSQAVWGQWYVWVYMPTVRYLQRWPHSQAIPTSSFDHLQYAKTKEKEPRHVYQGFIQGFELEGENRLVAWW